MITARGLNLFFAFIWGINFVGTAHDWYTGKPASVFVWLSGIGVCVVLFTYCVRDAIRGEW